MPETISCSNVDRMSRTWRKVSGVERDLGHPVSAGPRVAIYHRVSTLDQDPYLARVELEAWVARQAGQVAPRAGTTCVPALLPDSQGEADGCLTQD